MATMSALAVLTLGVTCASSWPGVVHTNGTQGNSAKAISFLALRTETKAKFDVDTDEEEGDDGGDDEFEYGDVIEHAKDEDASDYSMHQFLAADDGRGVEGAEEDAAASDNGDDGEEAEVEKSQSEADDDDFDSEDTPADDDSFIQLRATTKSSKAKFDVDTDEEEGDDGGDDEFEYGDVIEHAKDEDASDYSMHQFLAADDGRGVEGAEEDASASENGDDGEEAEVEKSQSEADDDDFDSEDTPADDDSFIQLKANSLAELSVNPTAAELSQTRTAPNVEADVQKERMQDVYIHDGFGAMEKKDASDEKKVKADKDLKA